ncbi:hypothetical protein [Terrisporobacter mayombei]|uniref:Uncharacterized protein n=1 Tax=Terrisporobacter mayombei TaxID=1541 RepID=A0ABY9PZ92_9FIRM|nr:hypothetical protein [Terrisporobacter mayombei]MCC3868527.1 hypothetical protein [Terrisporobacter mayombei]WMT80684.1 hypothetical protein TEMA_10050 [Terrisporobacter mayombei]
MKKILSLVISLIIVIGMVGCNTTKQAVNDAKQDVIENTTDLESMDKYVQDLLSKAFVDGDVSVSTTKDKDIYVTTIAIIDNKIDLQGLTKDEIKQQSKESGLTKECDEFVKQITEYCAKQGIDTNILFNLTDSNWISAYEYRYDNLQNTDEQSNNNTKKTTDKRSESVKKTTKSSTKTSTKDSNYDEDGFYKGVKDGTHLGEMNNGCVICGEESNYMMTYKGTLYCHNCGIREQVKDENKQHKKDALEREKQREEEKKQWDAQKTTSDDDADWDKYYNSGSEE